MTDVLVTSDVAQVLAANEQASVVVTSESTSVKVAPEITNLSVEGASDVEVLVDTRDTLIIEVPGLQGPPGTGTATSPALATDYTDPRYWFLGYADNLIKRLDNATAPPLVQRATGTWVDRYSLSYT